MVCGFRRRVVSGMREKGVCCVDLQASKVPIKQCTDRQVLARQLQVVPMALSIGTLRGRCDEGIAQHQESRIKNQDTRCEESPRGCSILCQSSEVEAHISIHVGARPAQPRSFQGRNSVERAANSLRITTPAPSHKPHKASPSHAVPPNVVM
jgi:hypothetical protein